MTVAVLECSYSECGPGHEVHEMPIAVADKGAIWVWVRDPIVDNHLITVFFWENETLQKCPLFEASLKFFGIPPKAYDGEDLVETSRRIRDAVNTLNAEMDARQAARRARHLN